MIVGFGLLLLLALAGLGKTVGGCRFTGRSALLPGRRSVRG